MRLTKEAAEDEEADKAAEEDLHRAEALSKYLFSKRRKTLKNSLKGLLDSSKKYSVDLSKRVEVLTPEELLKLSLELKTYTSTPVTG